MRREHEVTVWLKENASNFCDHTKSIYFVKWFDRITEKCVTAAYPKSDMQGNLNCSVLGKNFKNILKGNYDSVKVTQTVLKKVNL